MIQLPKSVEFINLFGKCRDQLLDVEIPNTNERRIKLVPRCGSIDHKKGGIL